MDFVNRSRELAALRDWIQGGRPSMARLYGRRRLGKTELLRTFCADQGGLYFLIDEADEHRVLASLSEQLAQQTDTLRVPLRTWGAFYDALADAKPPVVILDEFQRLTSDHSLAVTRLQDHWDRRFSKAGPSLVLCGSSIGMMQRLTRRPDAPLYGRLGFDMRLRPFGYAEMKLLYRDLSEEDRVRRYAVFGGTPHYHAHSIGRTLPEAIGRSFLQENAPYIDEPQTLLRSELRAPLRYNSIMYEIGQGTHNTAALGSKVGVGRGGLGPYLQTLKEDMDLLQQEDPVCGTKKQARYIFSDPFFTFYYRFIFNARPRLELGRQNAVLQDIERDLEGHVGRVFEDIARQALTRANGSKQSGVDLDFDSIGRWWNRSGEEIDIVAEGPKEILAAEVKWGGGPAGPGILQRLLDKTERMERTHGKAIRPGLIVRDGLTATAASEAQEAHALVMDLQDIARLTKPA